MIPSVNDFGYLPPGVHKATLSEIEARFGSETELRRVQMESVRWMVELAKRAGVRRIVLNERFVSDIIEPNDVDCVLLIESGFPSDTIAWTELSAGLPFLEMKFVGSADFEEYVGLVFGSDRMGVPKGVCEIVL
jgi:hypothetical protein